MSGLTSRRGFFRQALGAAAAVALAPARNALTDGTGYVAGWARISSSAPLEHYRVFYGPGLAAANPVTARLAAVAPPPRLAAGQRAIDVRRQQAGREALEERAEVAGTVGTEAVTLLPGEDGGATQAGGVSTLLQGGQERGLPRGWHGAHGG